MIDFKTFLSIQRSDTVILSDTCHVTILKTYLNLNINNQQYTSQYFSRKSITLLAHVLAKIIVSQCGFGLKYPSPLSSLVWFALCIPYEINVSATSWKCLHCIEISTVISTLYRPQKLYYDLNLDMIFDLRSNHSS